MKIYTYLFFLAVGLFMMTAAMCNKETPKPTRPVFEADTTGTGGGGNDTSITPGDTTTPPPPKKAKVTVFVWFQPLGSSVGIENVDVIIITEGDTEKVGKSLPGLPTPKPTDGNGKVVFEGLEKGKQYFIYAEWVNPNKPDEVADNYKTDFDIPRYFNKDEQEVQVEIEVR